MIVLLDGNTDRLQYLQVVKVVTYWGDRRFFGAGGCG